MNDTDRLILRSKGIDFIEIHRIEYNIRSEVLKEAAERAVSFVDIDYDCRERWGDAENDQLRAAILGDTAPLRPEDTYPPECGQYVDPKDWPEDFVHENGNYQNTCVHCGQLFVGHKRRYSCKECTESVDNERGNT